ncbi:DUF3592 domain-containing protein [Hymenobacter sediminis]|nr:DUF3592 domain-containing protein [Hymenobacter sediminis]
MARQSSLNLWLRAWLFPPLAVIALLGVLWKTGQRWRTLHSTQVPATVCRHLSKEGSGSSGVYYLIVKYQRPQGNEFYARVVTNRSTHDDLSIGTSVQVCYSNNDHQNALLASERAFTGKLVVVSIVCLILLFDGLGANREWRSRRPNGYFPN